MTSADKIEIKREIDKVLHRYYREVLKPLRLKNKDAEENVWFEIDNLCDDVADLIADRDFKINDEISSSIVHDESRDMESYLYNCVL